MHNIIIMLILMYMLVPTYVIAFGKCCCIVARKPGQQMCTQLMACYLQGSMIKTLHRNFQSVLLWAVVSGLQLLSLPLSLLSSLSSDAGKWVCNISSSSSSSSILWFCLNYWSSWKPSSKDLVVLPHRQLGTRCHTACATQSYLHPSDKI